MIEPDKSLLKAAETSDTEKARIKANLDALEAYTKNYEKFYGLKPTDTERGEIYQKFKQLDDAGEKAKTEVVLVNNNSRKIGKEISGHIDDVKRAIAALPKVKGMKKTLDDTIKQLNNFDGNNDRHKGPAFEARGSFEIVQEILKHRVDELGPDLTLDGVKIDVDVVSYGKITDNGGEEITGRVHAEIKASPGAMMEAQGKALKRSAENMELMKEGTKLTKLRNEIVQEKIDKARKQIKAAEAEGGKAIVIIDTLYKDGLIHLRTEPEADQIKNQRMIKDLARVLVAVPELIVINQYGKDLRKDPVIRAGITQEKIRQAREPIKTESN